MRRRYVVLLICLGVFLAWGITAARKSPFSPVLVAPFSRALAEGKNKWSTHQPINYRMHVSVFESLNFGSYRLTVRNGVVTDAACETFTPEECRDAADASTIPKLFDYAEKLYEEAQTSQIPSVQFDFQFDPTYGFPQSVGYKSTSSNVFDFGAGMRITDFEVLP